MGNSLPQARERFNPNFGGGFIAHGVMDIGKGSSPGIGFAHLPILC